MFFRVLIEQWIRAKYERREFIHVDKQVYLKGTMEGTLMKKSKDENKYYPRKFKLSEVENSLKYFNKEVNIFYFFFEFTKTMFIIFSYNLFGFYKLNLNCFLSYKVRSNSWFIANYLNQKKIILKSKVNIDSVKYFIFVKYK